MRKVIVSCVLLVLLLTIPVVAVAMEKYISSNYQSTSERLYKGIPIDWWVVYYLKEFDKYAPPSGSNWTSGTSKWNSEGVKIIEWMDRARIKGWVIKTLVTEARPGALGIKVNESEGSAIIFFVKEVHPWGVVAGVLRDGEPSTARITYESIRSYTNGSIFRGYIWPVRQEDYRATPEKYDSKFRVNDETTSKYYKGYKESWRPTWILKEFDKIAPAPGVNWTGSAHDWIINADAAGWKTSTDYHAPKLGSIVVRSDRTNNKVWISIIRHIRGDSFSVENFNGISSLKLDDLPAKYFVGYIYPERK